MKLTEATSVLRDALRIFSGRGARFLGAAVAFYALLSAAPLFVVVLRVVGALFGRPRAEGALWGALGAWIAPESLETVRLLTERLDAMTARGGSLGVLVVIYGSTRLFRAVRRALNQLWGIDLELVEGQRSKAVKYGIRYGQALSLTLLVIVLVVSLLGVKTAFAFVGTLGTFSTPLSLWALDGIVSVALAFLLFTALFRWLPETDVTWRDAATCSAVSTLLFASGSALVTAYVHHKDISDLYAGATTLVLVVLWVYYSAQVFFLGACVGAALRARRESQTPSA